MRRACQLIKLRNSYRKLYFPLILFYETRTNRSLKISYRYPSRRREETSIHFKVETRLRERTAHKENFSSRRENVEELLRPERRLDSRNPANDT